MNGCCRRSCVDTDMSSVDSFYLSDKITSNMSNEIAREIKSCLKKKNDFSFERKVEIVHFSNIDDVYVYQNVSSFHPMNETMCSLLEKISLKRIFKPEIQKPEICVNDISENTSPRTSFLAQPERKHDLFLKEMFDKINMSIDFSINTGIENDVLGYWYNSMPNGGVDNNMSDSIFDSNSPLTDKLNMQDRVLQVPSRWSRLKAFISSGIK